MKNKIFIVIVGIAVVAGFFFMKNQSPENLPGAPTPPTPSAAVNFVRPHSPSFGNTLGRATMVEWFDPECEACRVIHPVVKKIIDDYKDRVHFVFRYMPLHGNSLYAAAVLEEARELGKYEEALDLLFEKQPEWGDHHQPRPELIPGYLAQLGIPKESLVKENIIKKHREKVDIDERDGADAGVRGTPTFFVNGKMVHGLSEAALRAALDEALQ